MSSPTSISNLLTWAGNILTKAGVPSPQADAEWTLAHVLECSRSELHLRAHQPLTPAQNATFCKLIHRRANRIPLQHLLGNTEFYGLPFHTSPDALIPRPETEILIEVTLNRLNTCTNPRILDIGTGSGIIAITLGKSLPGSHIIATDISRKALYLASQNARLNGVSHRISFLQTDLLTPLCTARELPRDPLQSPLHSQRMQLTRYNPKSASHDPRLALDGGPRWPRFLPQNHTRKRPPARAGRIIGFGNRPRPGPCHHPTALADKAASPTSQPTPTSLDIPARYSRTGSENATGGHGDTAPTIILLIRFVGATPCGCPLTDNC